MACDIDKLECKVKRPGAARPSNTGNRSEVWVFRVAKIYPEDIVFISLRDLEKAENYLINKHGITNFTAEEVHKRGAMAAAQDTQIV